MFPHLESSAAVAKSDEESDGETPDEGARPCRGRSQDRGGKLSGMPGETVVCRSSSWAIGGRKVFLSVAIASSTESTEGNLLESSSFNVKTPAGHLAFGLMQILARNLAKDEPMNLSSSPAGHYLKHRHATKSTKSTRKLRTESLDRAEDLIVHITEDELEEPERRRARALLTGSPK